MGLFTLPEGYVELRRIDFMTDKRLAVGLNVAAGILAVLLCVIGIAFRPISSFLWISPGESLPAFLLRMAGVLLALCAYIVVHEWIHGIFIRLYSGRKAKYGFTGLFAYASSEAFFNKRQFIVIALAPVVLCGAVFFLLLFLLPEELFWPVYFLQVLNLTGAAGDAYLTRLMAHLPADVLTHDEGTTMILYSKQVETGGE